MDNLYGPGNPKPFCVGNDAILPSCSQLDPYGNPNCACPNGGHQLIIVDPDTTLRTTGSATVDYNTLFNQPDRRNGDQLVTHASFMAYFSITGQPVSLPNANCVKYINKSSVSVVPNCTNISGPATLVLGQTGTYSAKFVAAASGGLTDGSIFYSRVINGADQKDIHDLFTNPYNRPVSNGQTLTTTFTPSAVGQYWLRCRAWNDGIAECRPPATVDQSPRFPCTGPGYEMLVTVTQPASTCRQACSDSQPCASGFTCQGGVCRNTSCPTTDDNSCACPPAPMCVASKVFELKNNQWTAVTDPSTLKAGTAIRFGAQGNVSATKARFQINGATWVESTSKMTAADGNTYFYLDHTLITGNYSVHSAVQ